MQGATSLSQHDQYAAHQHMALHNPTNDMAANQSIASLGSTLPSISTQQPYYAAPNLGTAVASSMNLTNSSHDNDVLGATGNYKSEHEYYYPVIEWRMKQRNSCFFFPINFILFVRILHIFHRMHPIRN